MIENMSEFVENEVLFNKVISEIKNHGFEEIKIYKSDRGYDRNAICFYVAPRENLERPAVKVFDLIDVLESEEFLGCHIEMNVYRKNQLFSEREKQIIEKSISITDINFDKQALIELYKDVELKKRPQSPVINRATFILPPFPKPPMPYNKIEIKNNESGRLGEERDIFFKNAQKRTREEEGLEKAKIKKTEGEDLQIRNEIIELFENTILCNKRYFEYIQKHPEIFDDLKSLSLEKNSTVIPNM